EAKFEAKRREVRGLKETLEQIQKELSRRENAPVPESLASRPAPAENDPALRQLRDKVKQLQSDLKERHSERNDLQHRLEKMQARVDSMVERNETVSAESAGDPDADHEEDLLLPQEAEGNHPFRLLEFPRNFLERLNDFPRHVARSAMVILGRLA